MAEDLYAKYHTLWQNTFPTPRAVAFNGSVVTNAYCPDCRYCCGPQAESEPFPMALLDRQVRPTTAEDFYMLDAHTACLDQRGCKALGKCGCRLDNQYRPIACAIFPYVLVNMRLYLYRICPASMLLDEEQIRMIGTQVFTWLQSFPLSDTQRISITRRPEDIREKYLDLGLGLVSSS